MSSVSPVNRDESVVFFDNIMAVVGRVGALLCLCYGWPLQFKWSSLTTVTGRDLK